MPPKKKSKRGSNLVSLLQVVKNVAEQRSSRHRDTSRSRQAEAAVEAAAFAAGAH